MKKTLILLLALLMISQSALCAYNAYPCGNGWVEVTGIKKPNAETTLLIMDSAGASVLDVGQVGKGDDVFSKKLWIGAPDGLTYNVEIGTETVEVINISAEYVDSALSLIAQSKSSEAISKYLGLFEVDVAGFASIAGKNRIYDYLDGNVYSDAAGFEADFADALTLGRIYEASGDRFIELVRASQAKIGMDLSESSGIAPIVFDKVDARTLTSFGFDALHDAFAEEISLGKLNAATEDTARAVLEAENAVLGLLDMAGYSSLSETDKTSVCQALARAEDFASIQAAKDEFALLIQRASTPGATIEPPPSSRPGGSYSVSGGSAGGTQVQQPSSSSLPFTDISPSHWGYESISSLYSQGIVSGTSTTTFEPEREVKREEFVKMLVGTFGMYNPEAKNVFTDIAADDWCAAYVASAFEKGLTTGRGDGTFGKGELLTRQDMATLASRCAEIAKLEFSNVNSVEFADEAHFAPYATQSIHALAKAGIINGVGGGVFSPNTSCTRAMAAKVCSQLLKLYKGGVGA